MILSEGNAFLRNNSRNFIFIQTGSKVTFSTIPFNFSWFKSDSESELFNSTTHKCNFHTYLLHKNYDTFYEFHVAEQNFFYLKSFSIKKYQENNLPVQLGELSHWIRFVKLYIVPNYCIPISAAIALFFFPLNSIFIHNKIVFNEMFSNN